MAVLVRLLNTKRLKYRSFAKEQTHTPLQSEDCHYHIAKLASASGVSERGLHEKGIVCSSASELISQPAKQKKKTWQAASQ